MINTYNIKDKLWRVYTIVMCLAALFSLNAYFFWHLDHKNLYTLFGLITGVFFLRMKWFSFNRKTFLGCFLVTVAMFAIQKEMTLRHFIFLILRLLPICSVIALRDDFKVLLFQSFSKMLGVILAISAGGWILNFIGVPLFHTFDFFGEIERGGIFEHQYIFNNYFLFVQNTGFATSETDMLRFSAIFLEPGYFAILLTFVLYIDNFNLNTWYNKVFLISLALTLSLAGYIMVFFAFLSKLYSEGNRKLFGRLVGLGVVMLVGYFIAININDGDNTLNNLIFSRLEWNESENTIEGYNRTNEALDDQFERVLLGDNLLWGSRDLDRWAGGVGYKYYIVMYGIGSLFIFLISIFYQYKNKKNIASLTLFILYFIMFCRGHGTIFYTAFWLVYVCGIEYATRLRYRQ